MKDHTSASANIQGDDQPVGIEWMLQSNQVSDRELIVALLKDYQESLSRTSAGHYPAPHIARLAMLQTLAVVVAERQQYWGDIPFDDWLDQITVQVFHRLDQQLVNQPDQIIRVIQDAEEISLLESIEEEARRLRRYRLKKKLIPIASVLGAILLLFAGFAWWFSRPERDPAYIAPDRVRFYYTYTIEPGDTLESISQLSGIAPQAIRKLNAVETFPSSDQAVIVGVGGHGYEIKLPVFKAQISFWERLKSKPPLPAPSQPLTLQSNSEEIRDRLRQSDSYWNSLYVEYWLIRYRAPGYVGKEFYQVHVQVYARQPEEIRREMFNPDGSVQVVTFQEGNRLFDVFSNEGMIKITNLAHIDPAELDNLSPAGLNLKEPGSSLRVVGSEEIAGRDALVVDWSNSKGRRTHRLWIDTRIGLILAWRYFSGGDGQSPGMDMMMTQLKVNEAMDDRIFDPSKVRFDRVPAGQPPFQVNRQLAPVPTAPANLQPAPSEFDPSKSRLILQWAEENRVFPVDQDPGLVHQIRVFGDQYFLGRLYLGVGDLIFQNCSRSPNGRLVAILVGTQSESANNSMVWFDLKNPAIVHKVVSGGNNIPLSSNTSAVFSPDSRRLAFFSSENLSEGPGIYIEELSTERVSRMWDIPGWGYWLGWSLDGERIAALVRLNSLPLQLAFELEIYSISSGKLLYSGPFDYKTNQPAKDAPMQGLDPDFSQVRYGGKGCAVP